jgi:hypothetical protein
VKHQHNLQFLHWIAVQVAMVRVRHETWEGGREGGEHSFSAFCVLAAIVMAMVDTLGCMKHESTPVVRADRMVSLKSG